MTAKRVAIIGGGIAGLTAAYHLQNSRRNGFPLEWTLLEKSGRLGGVIRTENRDGYVLEAGPDSFLTIKSEAAQLCRELGIADQLIGSNDADRKTWIAVKGRLVPIPDGLQFMVPTRLWPMLTTPLFSLGTKLKMVTELFTLTGIERADEPVADFVRRHFGQQMVDRVAEPLLAGVYGGNADQLSVRAVLPRFVEMEEEHGSLTQAALRSRQRDQVRSLLHRRVPQKASSSQALFTSLKKGMQQIVDALLCELPHDCLQLHQSIVSLRRSGRDWEIDTGDGSRRFDEVLMAVPARESSRMLEPVHTNLAVFLGRIRYTSSVAVTLAYGSIELLPGHGFLIPSTEGRKMLACTFVHRKFPYRAPEGTALLRCFFSSARVPNLLNYDDATLESLAQKELQEILGVTAAPRFMQTFRWDCGLPQYETGHLERVAQMEKWLAEMPGLQIIGNSFHGVGVPDCIRSARQAVAKIISAAPQPAAV